MRRIIPTFSVASFALAAGFVTVMAGNVLGVWGDRTPAPDVAEARAEPPSQQALEALQAVPDGPPPALATDRPLPRRDDDGGDEEREEEHEEED